MIELNESGIDFKIKFASEINALPKLCCNTLSHHPKLKPTSTEISLFRKCNAIRSYN